MPWTLMSLSPVLKKVLEDLLKAGGVYVVKKIVEWVLRERKGAGSR